MSPVLHGGRRARRRRTSSFPKDRLLVRGGKQLSVRESPAPNLPLSPLEGEILSVCLRSQEDPREIGILPAMLSVEQGGAAT